MYKHIFDPSILRSYDIRGIFEKTLNPLDAWMLGFFFGTNIKQNKANQKKPLIIIGMDGRLSSPVLEDNLNKGLQKAGCDVYRIGIGPTPMLYFASKHFFADGAIQVTGSHNPKDHNGFKMVANQNSFFGDDILKLGKLAQEGVNETHNGSSKKVKINDRYIKKIIKPILQNKESLSNQTIVWDCGNGATGPSINEIVKKLPGNHIVLFSDVDGNFPNHHPDPTVEENLQGLIEKVRSENAELGIGFDGDADRIGLVDEKGNILWGDQLLTIFARDILSRNPGATIVGEVKCSQNL